MVLAWPQVEEAKPYQLQGTGWSEDPASSRAVNVELKAAGATDTSSYEPWKHHRNRHSHRTESLAYLVKKTSY